MTRLEFDRYKVREAAGESEHSNRDIGELLARQIARDRLIGAAIHIARRFDWQIVRIFR